MLVKNSWGRLEAEPTEEGVRAPVSTDGSNENEFVFKKNPRIKRRQRKKENRVSRFSFMIC